jgi:hypothetical protein
MQSLEGQDIIERRLEELREHDRHFPDRRHPIAALTEAIVWCEKVHADALTLEGSADARRPMADIMREEDRLITSELERARAAVPDLESGLRLARAAGSGEVAFDSRDPKQDAVAGAMISTLVSSGLAAVRTEELGHDAYCYYVTVDWAALDAFAARIGVPPVAEILGS